MTSLGVPHHCANCGEHVAAQRWAKGKRFCLNCGVAKAFRHAYLAHIFNSLTPQQKLEILAPYLVDGPQWTVLPSEENPIQEV